MILLKLLCIGLFSLPVIATQLEFSDGFGEKVDPKKLDVLKTKDDSTSSTTMSSVSSTLGCMAVNRTWSEGELVVGYAGPCKNCVCHNGKVHCSSMSCNSPLEGCRPIMKEGRCCPIRYKCNNEIIDDSVLQSPIGVNEELQARNMPEGVEGVEGDDAIMVDTMKNKPKNKQSSPRRSFLRRPTVKRRRVFQKSSSENINIRNRSRFKNRTPGNLDKQRRTHINGTRISVRNSTKKTTLPDIPNEKNSTVLIEQEHTNEDEKIVSDSKGINTEHVVPTVLFDSFHDSEIEEIATTTFESLITDVNDALPKTDIPERLSLSEKILTFNQGITIIEKESLDEIQPLKEVKNSLRDERKRRKNKNRTKQNELNSDDRVYITEPTVEDQTVESTMISDIVVEINESPISADDSGNNSEHKPVDITKVTFNIETITELPLTTETQFPQADNTEEGEIITSSFDLFENFPTYDISVGTSLNSEPEINEDTVVGIRDTSGLELEEVSIVRTTTEESNDRPSTESTSLFGVLLSMLRGTEKPPSRQPINRLNILRPSVNRTRFNRPSRPTRLPPRRKLTRPSIPRPFVPDDRLKRKEIKTQNQAPNIPARHSVIGTTFNVGPTHEETKIVHSTSSPSTLLPSEPKIENGFQGIKGVEEFTDDSPDQLQDNRDNTPTLPPSLPNLKIIKFVAADALPKDEIVEDNIFDNSASPSSTLSQVGHRRTRPTLRRPVGLRPADPSDRQSNIRIPLLRRPTLNRNRPNIRVKDTEHVDNTKKIQSRPDIFFRNRGNGTRRPFPHNKPSRFTKGSTTEVVTESSQTSDVTEPIIFTTEINNLKEKIQIETSIFDNIFGNTQFPIHPASLRPFTEKPIHPASLRPSLTEVITTMPPPTTTKSRPELKFKDEENDLLPFFNNPNLLPRPIKPTAIHSDDIANFLLQDNFDMPIVSRKPVLISTVVTPKIPSKKRIANKLPKIPDTVKNLLPLGIDPVLASGLFELAGCNVYGRMYDVNQSITALTAECKECRCTPVGVQCLPTC